MRTHPALIRTTGVALALLAAAMPALARRGEPKPAPLPPAPPGASGTYRDATGARHPWEVNAAFALTWDGAPYLPVGVTFAPRSVAHPEDAAARDADREALRAFKAAGIGDVAVAADGAAVGAAVAPWQRLIDQLEAEGLRYGLALPAALPGPAAGYYVGGGAFTSEPTAASGECAVDIQIPGYAGAIQRIAVAVLDADTGALLRVDWARQTEGPRGVRATADLTVPEGEKQRVVMTPFLTGASGLPDAWGGFEAAQDSLRGLSGLKLGPGLRFLVHPYSQALKLDGPGGYLVPVSDSYRLEFEAFLNRRYARIETLREQWAFRGAQPSSFQVAARLVPLAMADTKDGKAGYLLDEKERRCYTIAPAESSFWYDHLSFREQSLREHLNLVAQAIRQQIADVPVVVQRSGSMRRYHVNDRPLGGFAGIGIRTDAVRLVAQAGLAAGEARQAIARPWCLALALQGYRTKESLLAALDLLRQVGMKAWFVDPGDAPVETAAWLAEYRTALTARPDAADYRPRFLLYPHPTRETGAFGIQHPVVEVETRPVAPDAWWIPTLPDQMWHSLDVGEGLRAYGMQTRRGYEIHVWCPNGKRRIHIRPPAFGVVEVYDVTGKVLKRQNGNDRLRLDLGPEPTVLLGMKPDFMVPIEVAVAELNELDRLAKELGMRQGNAGTLQQLVGLARRLDPDRRPRDVRSLIRPKLEEARRMLHAPESAPAPPPRGAGGGS
ncbi:MAG: hypothetical protein HY321_08505 [Armatimonadetes bacterium]|nr:hypothetical protein [Armatimonadota bacterium]